MNISRIVLLTGTFLLLSAGHGLLFGQQSDSQDWSHIPRSETFDVVTWNIEWFGHDENGPDTEEQYQNVLLVIEDLQPDLIGVQEIRKEAQFNRLLGELDDYSGFITNYGWPYLQVGFIYNTTTVDSLFTNMIDETKDQDYYSWASGRFPLEFTFQAHIGNTSMVMYAVVIHAKAASDTESYNRRVNASRDIKFYFDEFLFHSPLIFLGDYNDDVIRSTRGDSYESPYKNFLDDPDYTIVTEPLSTAGEASWPGIGSRFDAVMFDHITVNHYLTDNWLQGSEMVYEPENIDNFTNTTSDHYPVYARFDITGEATATSSGQADASGTSPEIPEYTELLANYPNPFNPETVIPFRLAESGNVSLSIYNNLGQQVAQPVSGHFYDSGEHRVRFDATGLTSGIYYYRLAIAGGPAFIRKMLLVK